MSAVHYCDPIEVWNYGFWAEWRVHNQQIKYLYSRKADTSSEIIDDVKRGVLFSNKRFSSAAWEAIRDEFDITWKHESA